ncbi:hypothetical protein ACFX1Z_022171 [Malus domestica]
MQPSWEIEFDALISTTSGAAGPSTTTTGPSSTAECNVLVKLKELFSLLASQILERKGLDFMGECLNALAVEGLLSIEAITQTSSTLERTREFFVIFEKALHAEAILKAATAAQDAIHPKIEALKSKKEKLVDIDCQIVELQTQRSVIASDLAKDFESSGKSYLTDYAAKVKEVEQLKMDKRNRQAEVIMGEVRWLKLKAVLETLLPSSP